MKTTQKIKEKINSIKDGQTFSYRQLSIDSSEYQTAAKSIERLIKKGMIKRISTGIFYKPKQTVFGELLPSNEEILKSYLFRKGKRIAYITGTSLYNKLGLTTQVPQTIKIASRENEIKINKSNIKAIPAKSYIDVTNKNYQYLEILDSIKDFKKIQDLNIENGITILLTIIKRFKQKEVNKIIKLSLKYPPRARALLGALLESNNLKNNLKELQKSLNPLSIYSFGIEKKNLSTIENWNIK